MLFIGKMYLDDRNTIKDLRFVLNKVEDFYTLNGYYPTNTEFDKLVQGMNHHFFYTSYGENPLTYSLKYYVRFRKSAVFGNSVWSMFGSNNGYIVSPCPRWDSTIVSNIFSNLDYNYSPLLSRDLYIYINNTDIEGLIIADVKQGTVYFEYGGNTVPNFLEGKKVALLSGLDKPRLFQSGNFNKEIYVTNGNGIYLYKITTNNNSMQLVKQAEVGSVPNKCSLESWKDFYSLRR